MPLRLSKFISELNYQVEGVARAPKGGCLNRHVQRRKLPGLTGAKLTLGRDNSNSVQIGDATVSKKHCAIEAAGDSFELVDLESHDGTFVNGIPVKRRALMHGDVIRVGNSELLFLTREESQDDAVELQYSDDITQESLKTVQNHGRPPNPVAHESAGWHAT